MSQFTRSGLWFARCPLPIDLVPPGFRHYAFEQAPQDSLATPFGAITFSGDMFVRGFEVIVSDDLLPVLCVVANRSSGRRQHLVCVSDVDGSPPTVPGLCGNPMSKWERLGVEEPILICAKAKTDDGKEVWCTPCVKAVRDAIKRATGRFDGRAAHILLQRLPKLSAQSEERMMPFYVPDRRNHGDVDYGYCRDCRTSKHRDRGDESITDWSGRSWGQRLH